MGQKQSFVQESQTRGDEWDLEMHGCENGERGANIDDCLIWGV